MIGGTFGKRDQNESINSIIETNTTVTKSIPEHLVVAGFRSEIIAKCEDNTDYHKAIIVRPEANIFLSRRQLFERINDLESELKTLKERLKNGV